MLEFAEVSLGEGARAGCARCGQPAAVASYLGVEEVSAAIARAVAGRQSLPGPNVELTGPEPLGHPGLSSIVSAALAAGVRRLRLDTDAAAFCAGSNAAGAIAAGVRHVRFTLLGGTPGVHDALAGTPGAFDATLAGVRAYAAAAMESGCTVHVSALVPACRHTVRDLPGAVGAAVSAGASEVLLKVDDGGLDLGQAVPWVSSACATGVVNRAWVEVEGVPVCMLPGDELHVSDAVRARPGTHGPGCDGCPLRDVCAGGPEGACADSLAKLAPPPDAERLAARIRYARAGVPS